MLINTIKTIFIYKITLIDFVYFMAKIKRQGSQDFVELKDKLGKIVTTPGSPTANGIEYQDVTLEDLQVPTKVSINTILDGLTDDVSKAINDSQHDIMLLELTANDKLNIVGGVVNVNTVAKSEYKAKKHEDYLIVKQEITTNPTDTQKKYQYTAYICKDIRSAQDIQENKPKVLVWQALDGNYDASNVYITKEFRMGGNYKEIGNFDKGSISATATTGAGSVISAKGKSIEEFLTDMFAKVIQPTKAPGGGTNAKAPSCSILLKEAKAYEVGTQVTPHYSITFNDGSYDISNSKKQMANCKDTAYQVKPTVGSEVKTTKTGEFTKVTVSDDMNYKLNAVVTYSQGNVAIDNFGDASKPEVRYQGGTVSATSNAITGFRRAFVSTYTEISDTVDSASLRANNKAAESVHADSTSFNVNIPAGTKKVVLTTQKANISSIIDTAALNAEIKTMFVKQNSQIAINGLNNFDTANYNYWVFQAPSGLNNTTYKITLS